MVVLHPEKEFRYARLLVCLLKRRNYQEWMAMKEGLPLYLERRFRSYDVQVEIEIFEEKNDCLYMCVDADFGRISGGTTARDIDDQDLPFVDEDGEIDLNYPVRRSATTRMTSIPFYIVNLERRSKKEWENLLGTRNI